MEIPEDLIVLGIEGTAHTAGVGIIQGKEILANQKNMYKPETGGIHPRESADHMTKWLPIVIKKALEEAKISLKEIDAIAFSRGPGLGPCLRTTATAARTLALMANKPLIGVNHCVAHIELGRLLTGAENPITVYVSGGNTQITHYNQQRYRILGETLDVPIGNALDTIAREMGLPHPGGPHIEKLALKGTEFIKLPYAVKGMSLSYSGLITAATKLYKKGISKENIAFSVQEVAFGMLAEVSERALSCTESKELMFTGGVAANQRLKQMLKQVAEEQDATFYAIPKKLAGDNGVMIAVTGALHYVANDTLPIEKSYVIPRWRTDRVPILWRA